DSSERGCFPLPVSRARSESCVGRPADPRRQEQWRPSMQDKTAIVGVGATPYYRRGESLPQTEQELACKAILNALDDAGLAIEDLDGFAIYSGTVDPAQIGAMLGIPEIRFSAGITSGGGGMAGALGLAASAIVTGQANVVVTLLTLQQAARRLGGTQVSGNRPAGSGGGNPYG